MDALLSIIMPVYGTECFLEKSINSVIGQSYKNIELIIVNDKSPGDVRSIIKPYLDNHNIKYIENNKNLGLFHTRIAGIKEARGQYISFLDSDDYVSIDYYRELLEKAINSNYDIVESRIVMQSENGEKFIQNNNNNLFPELIGKDIQKKFFQQEGLFFHWHVIWNKIYKRELIEQSLPVLTKQKEHLIMTEDVLFSSVFFSNANSYASVDNGCIFYCLHGNASTGKNADFSKFSKNLSDIQLVFSFLLEQFCNSEYKGNINNWKERYSRIWCERIKHEINKCSDRNKLLSKYSLFLSDNTPVRGDDLYHHAVITDWDNRYEHIYELIKRNEVEYVSFDIFDTLLVRDFLDPSDVFELVDRFFSTICSKPNLVKFSNIRIEAESLCRAEEIKNNPLIEDITLDDIYNYILRNYEISEDIINKLKKKELEIEKNNIRQRKSALNLFNGIQSMGKKIILISDMYLSKQFIADLLHNSGYENWEKLYLSSDIKLTKHTGNLFKHVCEDLNINPYKIFHIGDNWFSDKTKATEMGLQSYYYPKIRDLLSTELNGIYSGRFFDPYNNINNNSSWLDNHYVQHNFGMKCLIANTANYFYDKPYKSINYNSDFNVDPFFIGHYSLGITTLLMCRWIKKYCENNNKKRIVFIGRDGYLIKEIFDKYNESENIKTGYIYASRRSLLPALFSEKVNIYGLSDFLNYQEHSPRSILELFNVITIDNLDYRELKKDKIIIDKRFDRKEGFLFFMKYFYNKLLSKDKLSEYKLNLKEYLINNNVDEDAITFDLGYSGRIQSIICHILEKPIDTLFMHTNNETSSILSKRFKFKVKCFYDFVPQISGLIREQLYSESSPSCIGYIRNANNKVIPVFEDYTEFNLVDSLNINKIHYGAIRFVDSFLNDHRDLLELFNISNYEASIPLEYYIHESKEIDRSLFIHSISDDFVHAGRADYNILEWWNWELQKNRGVIGNKKSESVRIAEHEQLFENYNIIKRTIYFILFEQKLFIQKLKKRILKK